MLFDFFIGAKLKAVLADSFSLTPNFSWVTVLRQIPQNRFNGFLALRIKPLKRF